MDKMIHQIPQTVNVLPVSENGESKTLASILWKIEVKEKVAILDFGAQYGKVNQINII